MNKNNSNISMVDLYQLLFVALKLCGKIDWSWWLVFAPILSWFALTLILSIAASFAKSGDTP